MGDPSKKMWQRNKNLGRTGLICFSPVSMVLFCLSARLHHFKDGSNKPRWNNQCSLNLLTNPPRMQFSLNICKHITDTFSTFKVPILQRITIWVQIDKNENFAPILYFAPTFGVHGIHWVNSNQILWGHFQKKIERLLSWMWEKFCFCFFSDSSLKRVLFGRMGRHFDGLMKCFSQNIHLGFVINWRPCPSINTQRKRYFFSVQKSNPLF